MPISPSTSALPGRSRTTSRPSSSACMHCAGVIAGPSSASAVPGPTGRATRPGRVVGLPERVPARTPASTTVSPSP